MPNMKYLCSASNSTPTPPPGGGGGGGEIKLSGFLDADPDTLVNEKSIPGDIVCVS